ncbi:MAG: hypothetical protein Q7K42_06090, partial [Candidatus Diapherotrites archaeon]|nr:hypothetical protein [Candidatus Diapherotrites archaeon]
NVSVKNAKIVLDIIEPIEKNFLQKDNVLLKVRAAYENFKELQNPIVKASINNEVVVLQQVSSDLFEGSYVWPESSQEGEKQIFFTAEDSAHNTVQKSIVVIIQNSILVFIQQRFYLIIFGILFALVVLKAILYFKGSLKAKRYSKEEEEFIRGEIKDLQDKYFNKGSLSKEQYDKEFTECNKRLHELKAKI